MSIILQKLKYNIIRLIHVYPDLKIKISGFGFGLDGSKILLSGFGSGHSGYPIFGADPKRISDRIRISDNKFQAYTLSIKHILKWRFQFICKK